MPSGTVQDCHIRIAQLRQTVAGGGITQAAAIIGLAIKADKTPAALELELDAITAGGVALKLDPAVLVFELDLDDLRYFSGARFGCDLQQAA